MKVFWATVKQGVAPNAITNNALINPCEKGKQPEAAQKIFQTMEHQGVVPDAVT